MKKLLATIMIMSMLLTTGLVAFAQEDNDVCMQLDSIEGIDLEAQMEQAEYFVRFGEQISKRRATTVLSNFKNLQQTDPNWANVVMQSEGKTIGSAGCCLTSFTMIQRYYGGTDNPSQVNGKLGSAACPFVYATAASKYGYKYNLVTSGTSLTNYVNYIKGAIGSGQPVLVGMEKPGENTHFVAAYGFDGNEIIISDPASRNYQQLSQYINNGYTVYRLCTYYK